jgi:60 kDa SS-A/Ro ribonucleoprotein
MAENYAGGVTFKLDPWKQLDRFLVLGSVGGTYYVSERKLTRDNIGAVLHCIQEDGKRAVDRIVEISTANRAPKKDPAIFALALASADASAETRSYALRQLHKVCWIPTHLWMFLTEVKELRGRGPALKKAIQRWYNYAPLDRLAMHVVKYRERLSWSHADTLNLFRPSPDVQASRERVDPSLPEETQRALVVQQHEQRKQLYRWIVRRKMDGDSEAPDIPIINGYLAAQKATKPDEWAALTRQYSLTREMLPTEALKSPKVWEAMLDRMPMTALVRNLGNMTRIGLIKPMAVATKRVLKQLGSKEQILKSKIHPIQLLYALKTYGSGMGFRGQHSWQPVQQVVDALDEAFYTAFGNVEATGKNILIGLDVSGSMGTHMSESNLTVREAASAMCMITARTEPNHFIGGFTSGRGGYYGYRSTGIRETDGFSPLKITPRQRLDTIVEYTRRLGFGGTDCSLPMRYAIEKGMKDVDAFVIYTDSETWAGPEQPSQSLERYRKKFNPDARLIVVGMTSTGFTIADPADAGQLDVVGFDGSTPNLISAFIKGEI